MEICLVGTGRCGTTLLRELLHRHPQLYVFDETHWVPQLDRLFGSRATPADRLIDVVARTRHVTGAPVCPVDRVVLERIFAGSAPWTVVEFCDHLGRSLARRAGKQAWGDKTPDYGGYLPLLHRLWPRCRFVHVVRDGLATVASMSVHPGYRWLVAAGETWWCAAALDAVACEPPAIDSFGGFVALWRRRLEEIRSASRALPPDRFLELRYEDLLAAPAPCLTKLASSLDLAAPRSWLEEAEALVDPSPIARPRPRDVLAAFGPAERRLLEETGYAGSLP